MSCSAEKLFQLKIMVKNITRCSRQEDRACSVAVYIRFLDMPEQLLCKIPPAVDKCLRADEATAVVQSVNEGRKFTFAMPVGGNCGPKPIQLDVKLYRLMEPDTLPSRTELASGTVDVAIGTQQWPDVDGCDVEETSTTMSLTDCQDNRTVAKLTVTAIAWCAGSVTSSQIELLQYATTTKTLPPPPPPSPSDCCGPTTGPHKPCCKPHTPRCKPQTPCRKPQTPCNKPQTPCRKPQTPCCDPPPSFYTPACRKCSKATQYKSDMRTKNNANRQYTNVNCEIDGRLIDMRIRKKNFETCADQRKVTSKADALASKVMTVIKDMHGLIMDVAEAKSHDLPAK